MNKWVKLIMVMLVVNVLVADGMLLILWRAPKKAEKTFVPTVNNSCPSDCNNLMDQKIGAIPTPVEAEIAPTKITNKTTTPLVKRQTIMYVPVPGSGSTEKNIWTDLPGTEFNLNSSDYVGLMGAYFEVNMKLLNGNGTGYVRLFDATAGIEVWGSEVQTSSQSFMAVSSGKLTLRSGNHLYKVQAKSLTADTTVFNSGKIKLITEN